MKKNLGKRQNREQKTLYLYKTCTCYCSCAGCASTPSNDYVNVRTSTSLNDSYLGLSK